jgi:hypothetical protein
MKLLSTIKTGNLVAVLSAIGVQADVLEGHGSMVFASAADVW